MKTVYKIVNDINDKVYIGVTSKPVEQRFAEHIRDSGRKRMNYRPLYHDIQKFGSNHFDVVELEKVTDECAFDAEKEWIEKYNSFKNGYNLTFGGAGKGFVDRDRVVSTFNKLNHINNTAREVGCDRATVVSILKDYGYNLSNRPRDSAGTGIPVVRIAPNGIEKHFDSVLEGVMSTLKSYGKTTKSRGGCISHVTDCCKGKRKTWLGYYWKYQK